MTPAEYSRKRRLDWAARRLSKGLEVGQAAGEVGYDSVAAFSRAFKQQFGQAPSKPASDGQPALRAQTEAIVTGSSIAGACL